MKYAASAKAYSDVKAYKLSVDQLSKGCEAP
jgi:hypothetical protein